MKILDTDTLTHYFAGHSRTLERFGQETDVVATTIVSRIEILQGRFAMLLKAAAGAELRRAQERLDRTPLGRNPERDSNRHSGRGRV